MIYTVTWNPAWDWTINLLHFQPGAVHRMQTTHTDPGGKGINVAKTLHALGEPCVALGILGGTTGQRIQEALTHQGIDTAFVWGTEETRTNIKIHDRATGHDTDINAAGPSMTPEMENALWKALDARLQPGDHVALSGALPAQSPADVVARWVRALRDKGAHVYVDADGAALAQAVLAGPTLIKPNADEWMRLTGRSVADFATIVQTARALMNAHAIEVVVLSLGAEGCVCVSESEAVHIPGHPVAAQSTVGAGDAMLAGWMLGRSRGASFLTTARWASAIATASLSTEGSQPPRASDVTALYAQIQWKSL